jgi:hypothetical protein
MQMPFFSTKRPFPLTQIIRPSRAPFAGVGSSPMVMREPILQLFVSWQIPLPPVDFFVLWKTITKHHPNSQPMQTGTNQPPPHPAYRAP